MAALALWTIYDHPRDIPDAFVARRFRVGSGAPEPTTDVFTADNLEGLRRMFAAWGLVRIPRSEGDDPMIVETWL